MKRLFNRFTFALMALVLVFAFTSKAKADPAFFAAAAANIPGSVAFLPLSAFIFWSVADSISHGGLDNKYVETMPGAGYHVATLQEQMQNNPELAIEVAMWEKANPGSTALASLPPQ